MTRKTKETALNVAARAGWEYSGDTNLERGGVFFRWPESAPWPASDFAYAVEVTDLCRAAGAPDGALWVARGAVYMPPPDDPDHAARVRAALDGGGYSLESYDPETGETVIRDCTGGALTGDDAARVMFECFNAYWGLDSPDVFPVAVGAACRDEWRDHPHCPESDPVTLRANVNLPRWVENEFL